MADLASLPSLSAPVGGHSDIARQHHALQVEIAELRAMIDSLPAPQRTDRYQAMLAVLVGRLGERLRTHFEVEDTDGYLEDVGTACPQLADDVARLHAEHVGLVGDAMRLADRLRSPTAPPDTVARILRWLDLLRCHELVEHDLVERAQAVPLRL